MSAALAQGLRAAPRVPGPDGTATRPPPETPTRMDDAKTTAPSTCDFTGAGECPRCAKDWRSGTPGGPQKGLLADTPLPWDVASAGLDPPEVVCGAEEQSLGIELREEWGLGTPTGGQQSCQGMEGECQEKVDHSYSRPQRHHGSQKGGLTAELGLPTTKDGPGLEGLAAQDGLPPLGKILIPPTVEELQNGISCDLGLLPTKDGPGTDSRTLQDGIFPLHNGVLPLQNILIPPTGVGSVENPQTGISRDVVLPPTKDGSLRDRVSFQNGISPFQNGVLPLGNILVPPSGDGANENLQNGGSCKLNLPPTKDGPGADSLTLQNGTSPLQNIAVLPTRDVSMESSTTLQNGLPSLCNPILLPTRDWDMNNGRSPLLTDGESAMLEEGNETLLAESCKLSTNLHSPLLYPECPEKCPETTKMADKDLFSSPVEADLTSGVSLNGERLGDSRIPLPLNEEIPPTSQNGNEIPYIDDLCLRLETWTITEDTEIITEREVDESSEITHISVRTPEETEQEREMDDRTQTSFLTPEGTLTSSDGDASLKESPDPSEPSVEKAEWMTTGFPADEEEITRPFKIMGNTTDVGETLPDDPSKRTASSALRNGCSLQDILMRPPLKCLNGVSSSRSKRRKILETEIPFGGFSRRTESLVDHNRALHHHWGSPKWLKRSVESSNRRPLSKPIPSQIVRSIHGVQQRVNDSPLRTIKLPFSLSKMAIEVPHTSASNMDPSRRTSGECIASLVDIFRPSKCTKETSLLRKLSALADTISSPWRLKPASNIPEFGRKMIPDLLSSVANVQKSNLQSSFSLFPLESANICILDSRSKLPFTMPSFQFKMAPVPVQKSTLAWKEMPFEWTFSFLLSQSITGVIPNSSPVNKDGGCPVGLRTVLALFSPGYSRLWARKWRLPVRRLAFFQFTGASKDPNSLRFNLFASLLSATFDSGLPTWRHLDPPSSEVRPLRSPQEETSASSPFPSPWMCLDLQNSSAMLPPATGKSMELPPKNTRWETSFSALTPTFLSTPEPPWSRLPVPAFPVRNPLEELEVPVPAPPQSAEPEKKKPKKVSQIRIRKAIPRPDPNLTPMGLPRPKRLKKTEFSLEEIYTNKNYKAPPATRSLETIFEEPKERRGGGPWLWVGHQKRRRILDFPDFTLPRKRRPRGRLRLPPQGFTRAQKATPGGRELDALLRQRLADLEDFCARHDHPGT